MKKIITVVICLLIPLSSLGQTKFIQYKKYLIPISMGCEGVSELEHVFYIDDVNDSRQPGVEADPNGVQELPILIGWANMGKYKLVGFGADGNESTTYNTAFVASLVSMAGGNIPVKTGGSLEDEIISQALVFQGCSSRKLQVAVGGPWHVVADAILKAENAGTPIDDLIYFVGIGGSNVTFSNNRIKRYEGNRTADEYIYHKLGNENVYQIDGGPSLPSFRWFFNPELTHVGNRNSWYQTHYHQSVIGRYFRDNVSNGFRLDEQNMVLNGCTEYGIEAACDNKHSLSTVPVQFRRTFRGADFTALAYIIWGDDIWSNEFETRMYSEIEAGLATLHK